MHRLRYIAICVCALSLSVASLAAGDGDGRPSQATPAGATDWNQWRGPNRNGIAPDGPKLADAWGSEGPALVWTSEEKIVGGPKKGGGFSNYGSPVVAKGKVYLYVHDQAGAVDLIYCLDAGSGKTLWKKVYPGSPDGGGSCTPYVGGGRVYAVGTLGMYCLDAETGKEVWKASGLCKDPKGDGNGINSSPALVEGVLAVIAGSNGRHLNPKAANPDKESGVLKGFDAVTGRELWACPEATADAHRNGDLSTSAAVWNMARGPKLMTQMGKLTCVNPKDGSVVWQHDDNIYASPGTPAIVGDVCITAGKVAGYRLGRDKAEKLFGCDVMDRCGSYLLHGGFVYGDFAGVYRCIDRSGKILWQKTAGTMGTSSPILADGKIFHIVSDKDEKKVRLTMFSATPTMPATFFEVGVRAQTFSSPAICGGRMFIRLQDGMACYDLTKAPATLATGTAAPATAAPKSDALISFVDISPSYVVMRKAIKDQVWPPENKAAAAALDWAANKPLNAEGWIDFIPVQDARGMPTRDVIAYARIVLEAAASGRLALSLSVPNVSSDPHGMAVWINGANVLRQEIAHPEGPVKTHEELIVNLVAGKNTLLVRTNTSVPHDWKLQIHAQALGGLVVKQVVSGAARAKSTMKTTP